MVLQLDHELTDEALLESEELIEVLQALISENEETGEMGPPTKNHKLK